MKPETAKKLVEPFDRRKLKTTQGMTYIPIAEVVARMNEAVGVGKWRVEILNTQSWGSRNTLAGVAPTHIIATVRVHVFDEQYGEWTWCDGMGGQDVGFFKVKNGETIPAGPLNLGDNYKGACSDATKKALQHLGVGLELARDGVGVEVADPIVDLSGEVQALAQHERKALRDKWQERKYQFKTNIVPLHLEQEVRTLINSFIGYQRPETKPQEQSDEGAVVEFPMNQPKAKKALLEVLIESLGDEAIATSERDAVWTESGYGKLAEIGAEEWGVLNQLAQKHIETFMAAVAPS